MFAMRSETENIESGLSTSVYFLNEISQPLSRSYGSSWQVDPFGTMSQKPVEQRWCNEHAYHKLCAGKMGTIGDPVLEFKKIL